MNSFEIRTTDPHGIKASRAEPDGTLSAGYRKGRDGKPEEWSRTLRRKCPWCEAMFYTYQRLDHEEAPGQVDEQPPIINGLVRGYRSTCGSPECFSLEYSHQRGRSSALIVGKYIQETSLPEKKRLK